MKVVDLVLGRLIAVVQHTIPIFLCSSPWNYANSILIPELDNADVIPHRVPSERLQDSAIHEYQPQTSAF
jgi:hypothetical protein